MLYCLLGSMDSLVCLYFAFMVVLGLICVLGVWFVCGYSLNVIIVGWWLVVLFLVCGFVRDCWVLPWFVLFGCFDLICLVVLVFWVIWCDFWVVLFDLALRFVGCLVVRFLITGL